MAQDIGSAILAGIQGVQESARQRQSMLLQQQEMDLARQRAAREGEQLKIQQEQLKINQNVDARQAQQQTELLRGSAKTRLQQDADLLYGRMTATNVLKGGKDYDRDRIINGLKSGDTEILDLVTRGLNISKAEEAINRGNFGEADFRFTGVDKEALKQGRVIAIGSYKDGRPGVLTAQGGSAPDENVVNLSIEEAADAFIENSKLRVIPNSNMGATSAEGRFQAALQTGESVARTFSRQPVDQQARTVLNTIDASGLPVEASRTFLSQLSSIKDPKQKQEFLAKVATDLGIQTETPAEGQFSQEMLGYDEEVRPLIPGLRFRGTGYPASDKLRTLDAQIKYNRKQADKLPLDSKARENFETKITELNTQRREFVLGENQRVWGELETESSRIKEASERPNATPQTKEFWAKKQEALDAKKQAFIKAGGYTPAMGTPDYAALEQNVLSKIKKMSPEEVASAIQKGQLKFSDQELRGLRARLTESNSRTVQTVAKSHNREETIASLAVLYGQSQNPAQQQQLLVMINNVAETGSPFLSDAARRELELQEQRIQADLQIEASRRAGKAEEITLAEIQAGDQLLKYGADILNPVDKDGKPTKATAASAARWATVVIPRNQFNIGQLARKDANLAEQIFKGTIGQASQAAAILFDQLPSPGMFGGVNDALYSWFGEKPSVDTMARRLENVRAVTDTGSDGVPRVKALYFVDRSGRQKGKELSPEQVKNIDGGAELFNIFATYAIVNENIAAEKAASNARQR